MLDENEVIPDVNLRSIAALSKTPGRIAREPAGIFSSFKNVRLFFANITDHYLIWNADTIMLKPIQF